MSEMITITSHGPWHENYGTEYHMDYLQNIVFYDDGTFAAAQQMEHPEVPDMYPHVYADHWAIELRTEDPNEGWVVQERFWVNADGIMEHTA